MMPTLSSPGPSAVLMPAYPLGAPDATDELADRLAEVESFGAQVADSIDQLVTAVIQAREAAEAGPPTLAPALADLAALKKQVQTLSQQLSIERACRDFAHVSRMHPKEARVVFVGTTYFGDNVKYAFLAVRQAAAAQGIDVVFLPYHAEQQAQVESLGARCFPHQSAAWSADDLHDALSAAVVVTSDHFLNPNPYAAALLAGARHVQLWHGVSIKEIGLRNLAGGRAFGPHLARVLATCGPYARMVGTTASGEAEWRRWFAFERYDAIGYPRNDVLHREPTEADLVNVDRATLSRMRRLRQDGRRVFFYAPTFRDGDGGQWLVRAGIERLAQAVAANGDALVVNLHPVEQPRIEALAPAMPSVHFVAPRTDAYPLLRHADALITDYSSVLFDWLHLDRPVLVFRPDHAQYTTRSRRLFDEKLGTLPGPLAADADTLADWLGTPGLAQEPAHAAQRETLRRTWFDQVDGHAGERLVAVIAQELAAAGVR
jgi:CDP-glycerol glycerophosphotransferase